MGETGKEISLTITDSISVVYGNGDLSWCGGYTLEEIGNSEIVDELTSEKIILSTNKSVVAVTTETVTIKVRMTEYTIILPYKSFAVRIGMSCAQSTLTVPSDIIHETEDLKTF